MDTINTVNRGDVSESSSTLSIITEIDLCANRDKHAFVSNETVDNWNNGFNKKRIFGNVICVDMPTNGATGWSYCEECETDVPPRAFHCLYCKGCVLKRDHHCHVLGTCIGFWNQRFFVVGSTYTVVTGIFGAHLCLSFLRASESVTFVGCLLPMTLVNWLLGSKPFLIFITTIHMYINALFTLLGIGFLATQVRVITQGLTLYEYKKRVPVKCSTSISENLRSVFGDYWALNFVFPFGFFVQQKGDGLTWDGVKFER
ncbi:hypothetical protein DPMN_005373 [Dreissena polymorpha]|uniref:Palmitoyltransferase n=2 Tax=Dreissena polymorpha TaxID=45954 RepID=A0A9D4RWS0_DREPO|nr:hypothetical protein DPMN_005373 [Dreissena polymorpha]